MTSDEDIPTSHFDVKAIGLMHCELKTREATPKNYTESLFTGRLEILPQYRQALLGIEEGQTIVALFWLHEARRDILQVHPRGDTSRPLTGVFATRSPVRPNPIAISELTVLKREDTVLTVLGVDVIDGTPLIDLKKKV